MLNQLTITLCKLLTSILLIGQLIFTSKFEFSSLHRLVKMKNQLLHCGDALADAHSAIRLFNLLLFVHDILTTWQPMHDRCLDIHGSHTNSPCEAVMMGLYLQTPRKTTHTHIQTHTCAHTHTHTHTNTHTHHISCRPWWFSWMCVQLVIRRLRARPLLGRQHSFVEI